MANTTQVAVTVTLNSATSPGPPYSALGVSCAITTSDNNTVTVRGWGLEEMPPPQSNGAIFTLTVVDQGWSDANQSQVAGWDLTTLARPNTNTTKVSPFASNVSTLTGGGDAGSPPGTFNLIAQVITNTGAWDWNLMIQMSANSVIKTFDSDPEMQVDTSQK